MPSLWKLSLIPGFTPPWISASMTPELLCQADLDGLLIICAPLNSRVPNQSTSPLTFPVWALIIPHTRKGLKQTGQLVTLVDAELHEGQGELCLVHPSLPNTQRLHSICGIIKITAQGLPWWCSG